jgi:hypothetical protein
MKEISGFRYRVEGMSRSVTKKAIQEARLKEIKQEMVISDKLQAHFEDNPVDLALLRHDLALRPQKVQAHMKTIPAYLMPAMLQEKQELLQAPGAAATHHHTGGNLPSTAGRHKWKLKHKVGKFRTVKAEKMRKKARQRRNRKKGDPLW